MSRNVAFHALLAVAFCAMPIVGSAAPPAAAGPAATATPAASATMDPDKARELARNVLTQLQNGSIDRSLFTDAMNKQLTDDQVQQLAPELRALGQPYTTILSTTDAGGGMTTYTYLLHASAGAFDEVMTLDSTGKIAGLNFVRDLSH